MINQVCTVKEIEDTNYGIVEPPIYKVKTKEGYSFTLSAKQADGLAIGSKIRYSVTQVNAKEPKSPEVQELEEAYTIIADLVEQAKTLTKQVISGTVAKKALVVSVLANLVALGWGFFL